MTCCCYQILRQVLIKTGQKKFLFLDCQRILNRQQVNLIKRNHKIKFNIDKKLNIYGSKSEIQSAFSNLVSNAIRYTPEKGNIFITWHLINNLPILEVTDNGVGIPKNKINRITERFYRIDEDRSRSSGGTGLGLSIVKNIMLQHQGQLEITSELNQGSTFKLIFPEVRVIKS